MKFANWIMRHRQALVQLLALLPTFAVIGVTAYASWGHIVHVAETVGEPSADLLPFAVDGMMLAGSFFALADRLRGYEPRGWSMVALVFGSLLTVTFNVASAMERGLVAMLISAVYAIAFLVTVEAAFHPSTVLIGHSRKALRRARKAAGKALSAPLPVVAPQPEPVTEAPTPAIAATPARGNRDRGQSPRAPRATTNATVSKASPSAPLAPRKSPRPRPSRVTLAAAWDEAYAAKAQLEAVTPPVEPVSEVPADAPAPALV